MANTRTLEGHLPICLSCKKIQDQRGDGQPFEYLRKRAFGGVGHSQDLPRLLQGDLGMRDVLAPADTSDTVLMGIAANWGNCRNCTRRSPSLVTRRNTGYYRA